MDWTVKALKSECHNPQQQRKHVKLCTLGLKRWVPSAALDSGQRTPWFWTRVLMVHYCWTTQFSRCTTDGLHSSHGMLLLDYSSHGRLLLDYTVLMVHHWWTTLFSRCTTAGLHSSHGAPVLDYTVLMVHHCRTTQFSWYVTAGLHCSHGMLLLENAVLMVCYCWTT